MSTNQSASKYQESAKLIIKRKKSWAVVKREYQDKVCFGVYTISHHSDRTAKQLFNDIPKKARVGYTQKEEPVFWKFYLPTGSDLKLGDDITSALDDDAVNSYTRTLAAKKDSSEKYFGILSGIMKIQNLSVKSILDKVFSVEESLLRDIIQHAYPEVSSAKYNNGGWFILSKE